MLKEKNEIIKWLDENKISNYELLKNKIYGYIVNVNGDVNLTNFNKKVIELSVKFGKVNGDFVLKYSSVKSFKGFPDIITKGLYCTSNEIESLDFFPKFIESDIDLTANKIKELKNLPDKVNGRFHCGSNQLESLEGCPKEIKGSFSINNNNVKSLKHCPIYVDGDFGISNNAIESLDYFPKFVGGSINLSQNKIQNLKNLPEKVNGYFFCDNNNLKNLEGCPKEIKDNFIFYNNIFEKLGDFHVGKHVVLDINIINLLNEKMIKAIQENTWTKRFLTDEITNEEFLILINKRNLNNKIKKNINIKNKPNKI